MKTWEFLTDPALAPIYRPGVIAGLAVAAMCAPLAIVVVLKRLSFIGQGVSHAAFGGAGVAYVLGFTGVAALNATPAESATARLLFTGIVLLFCVAASIGIGRMTPGAEDGPGRRSGSAARADTAIAVVLVASMALGFLLISLVARLPRSPNQPPPPGVETVLFGSVVGVGMVDALVGVAIAAIVLGTLWWMRRPILFWALDETSAAAFGVRTERVKSILLVLNALAIVTTMKLAGVILATALLVLPGATGLRLSERLTGVLAWSCAAGATGVLGGLILSFEADLSPGPSIVLVLVALYAAASLASLRPIRAAARA